MPPKPLSDDEIQRTVANAIEDARSFIETQIAPDRTKAQRYFDGETDLGYEDGRSRVVATKARDTVRAIKPVLMRVFLQTDKPVEFVPRTPQAVPAAQQATSYASYIFARNDGFRVLSDAFHDALVKKAGIVAAYYDETPEVEVDEYTSLPREVADFVAQDPEVEVIGQDDREDGTVDLRVARTGYKGCIKFDSIPPEQFFVDEGARNIRDCLICGHSNPDMRVGDLVAMGFDFEEVLALAGDEDEGETEASARRNYQDNDDDDQTDPSMRPVLFTQAYMRMDIEGTGVPRHYKFLCAGDDYTILRNEDGSLAYELCDMNPYAVFEVDPEPHTFFGRSLVDIIVDDQDAATALLRGHLDSLAMANNPRLWAVEGQANLEDVQNNEIGAIMRVKQPGMVGEFTIGQNVGAALPSMQYYDALIQAKTGVGEATSLMNPDALQNVSGTGAAAIAQSGQAQAELIARHLAEGGMRQLFEKIAQLARQHPDPEGMIRVDGQFVPVDPRSWTAAMDVVTNVGLGTGKHDERVMMLQATIADQMMLAQTGSPLVTQTHMRNARADLLGLSGISNADRYYAPMTPEIEQQMAAQAAQQAANQPPQMDPASQALLQAEELKAQQREAEAQRRFALDMVEAQANDDRERDRMAQDLFVDMAKLGQQQNVAALKAEQAARRPYGPQAAPGMPPQG